MSQAHSKKIPTIGVTGALLDRPRPIVATMPAPPADAIHLLQRPLGPAKIQKASRKAAQLRVVSEIDEVVEAAHRILEVTRVTLDEQTSGGAISNPEAKVSVDFRLELGNGRAVAQSPRGVGGVASQHMQRAPHARPCLQVVIFAAPDPPVMAGVEQRPAGAGGQPAPEDSLAGRFGGRAHSPGSVNAVVTEQKEDTGQLEGLPVKARVALGGLVVELALAFLKVGDGLIPDGRSAFPIGGKGTAYKMPGSRRRVRAGIELAHQGLPEVPLLSRGKREMLGIGPAGKRPNAEQSQSHEATFFHSLPRNPE